MTYDIKWSRTRGMEPDCTPVNGNTYHAFLERKMQMGQNSGFPSTWMPDALFPFQQSLTDWALRKGRAAIFADCGLGKTLMQLVWAHNVVRHTNSRVLILTPLAVGPQTIAEADKFDIPDCTRSHDGSLPRKARIIVTNYEKLHLFRSSDFAGIVCDESSILKHFSGATQKAVTRFMLKTPYRLLCTATAAPNDYIELGTSSEALGELGYSDMLSRFFRQSDNQWYRIGGMKQSRKYRQLGQWRLKHHAEVPFWRWVSSWTRACRKPSDLGFDDNGFILPPLHEHEHTVTARRLADGLLFAVPALGLDEEREERRRTLTERCEYVAELVAPRKFSVIWCHMNTEGDLLERLIPNSIQVAGKDSDEYKEAAAQWFVGERCICAEPMFKAKLRAWKDQTQGEQCICGHRGDSPRRLISKSRIFGFGLNFQHCAHVVTFASHSYEQFYQSVRRCWRFGQTQPVRVDIVSTEGERYVRDNMIRKAESAEHMFDGLIHHMYESTRVARQQDDRLPPEVPAWLS